MGAENQETTGAPGTAPGERESGGAGLWKRGLHGIMRLESLWSIVLAGLTLGTVATVLSLGLGTAVSATRTGSAHGAADATTTLVGQAAPADLAALDEIAEAGRATGPDDRPPVPPIPAAGPEPEDQSGRAPDGGPLALAMALPAEGALPAPSGSATREFETPPTPEARASLSSRTGTRPDEPTPTPRRGITKHVVAEGDTVNALADRYQIGPDTIVKVNHLDDPEHLTVGQEIIILPISGQLHTVESGDTVLDLATRYGVIPEDIVAANELPDANVLQAGQQLIIPEVPVAARASAEPQPLSKPLAPIKYEVVPGDTVAGIAQRNGISVESVLWANPSVSRPDLLKVGQSLTLPPVSGVLHTVAEGNTVNGVAARYGASSAEIIRVNALREPYVVEIGRVLVVPGGEPPQPVVEVKPTPKPTPRPTPRPASAAAPKPAPPPPPAPVVAQGSGVGAQVVNVALRYRGYRYVWGGSSPSQGFDCSGLTSYVYRQAGRPIPRDLWGQYRTGARISRASLQPGDLVFFQNTYTWGLSHVGIYIGGGRFIHAASPATGVIISGLGEAYWSARYLGGGRP